MTSKLQIWSHLLKKSLMENFMFCAVNSVSYILFSVVVPTQPTKKQKLPKGAIAAICVIVILVVLLIIDSILYTQKTGVIYSLKKACFPDYENIQGKCWKEDDEKDVSLEDNNLVKIDKKRTRARPWTLLWYFQHQHFMFLCFQKPDLLLKITVIVVLEKSLQNSY